jgi:hypothetical protein
MLGFTVINDPHGTIAVVFSMIPLTSPIVMLMNFVWRTFVANRHICNVIVCSFFVSFGLLQSVPGYCNGKKPTLE